MASFKRYTGSAGDAAWPAGYNTIYTVPSATTSVITGLTLCNTTLFELPVSVVLTDNSANPAISRLLLREVYVPAGQSIKVAAAEKAVLEAGDLVQVTAPLIDGVAPHTFHFWLSVYEDV